MRGGAPIGVDDDLAAGQTGVPIGPTDDELACRVDEPVAARRNLKVAKRLANIGFDDLADLGGIPVRIEMLGGKNDLRNFGGLAADIAYGDLALGIRPELSD